MWALPEDLFEVQILIHQIHALEREPISMCFKNSQDSSRHFVWLPFENAGVWGWDGVPYFSSSPPQLCSGPGDHTNSLALCCKHVYSLKTVCRRMAYYCLIPGVHAFSGCNWYPSLGLKRSQGANPCFGCAVFSTYEAFFLVSWSLVNSLKTGTENLPSLYILKIPCTILFYSFPFTLYNHPMK